MPFRRSRRRLYSILAGFLLCCLPGQVLAHDGAGLTPGNLWTYWLGEPWPLLALGVFVCLYALGTHRIWHQAGEGRGVSRWQVAAFAGFSGVFLIALETPLNGLSMHLFAVHMVQHQLLIMVAAPLLVTSAPLLALAWALPRGWRPLPHLIGQAARAGVRLRLTHPLTAWTLHAIALWLWHLPLLYNRTSSSALVHALQHASFLGTAVLFWWPVLRSDRFRRLTPGGGVLYLFAMAIQGVALGALLTFARHPWYDAYGATTPSWGLTPLEDQQLGGLIMWIPFGTIYLLVAALVVARWLSVGPPLGRAGLGRLVAPPRQPNAG